MFKKILVPILITIYQFFAVFFSLVIGEMVMTGYSEPGDIVIIILIFAIGYAVIAACYIPLWFLFKYINNRRPAIKRKNLIIHHLIGFIFILYLLLLTFIPKFPNALKNAFDYDVFSGKKLFIFGIIPIVGTIVAAKYLPFALCCEFVGPRGDEMVYEEVVDLELKDTIEFDREKVGEKITTTTYYDTETGYSDHEETEVEDIYKEIPRQTEKWFLTYVRFYECPYCGRRYSEEEEEKYYEKPDVKVGDFWCAYDDPSEFKK